MTEFQEPRRAGRSRSSAGRVAALVLGITGLLIVLAIAVGPNASDTVAPEAQAQPSTQVRPAAASAPSEPSGSSDELPSVDALSRAFATVVDRLKPAVVNVFTEGSERPFEHPGGTPFDDFFQRFFRDQPQPPEQRRRSLGSGVVVDPRGYIITNNHVVENAEKIEVQFPDERRFEAELIGSDPPTDLAVLRIKSDETFPSAEFGSSENLVVGEWVLAMRNPFGFSHTVTAGIVSAKGRVIGQGAYDDFIQTDASINPGNSGGPLVNMKAQIVGINSNIISSSGGNMGIGFAIPSDMIRNIYDQLVTVGKVTRGWLGVSIQNLTPELAKSFGLEGQKGALVSDVLGDDTPAAKAGLKAGDIIVEFDGVPVESNSHLVHVVADVRPGESVSVKFYRDGKLQTAKVTMALRTIDDEAPTDREDEGEEGGRLGISGQNLTEQMASELNAASSAGVVLMEVDPNGPAADAGLRRGDIVIEANRETVRSVDDLQRIIAGVPAGGDLLLRIERIVRGQQSSFLWIPVQLE